MSNSFKVEVDNLFEKSGNFSFKIRKYMHMPYQIFFSLVCIFLYLLGFYISLMISNNHYDFVSSWAVIIGCIGLYTSILTAIWAEKTIYQILVEKIRNSFDVSDDKYFREIEKLVYNFYNFKRIIAYSILYILLAISVVISFWQGKRENFLPGFAINLTESWIFMMYIILWAIIVSLFIGLVVHCIVLSFQLNSILKKFKIIFKFFHPDGMFGFKPLSNFLIIIVLAYYFVILLFIVWLMSDLDFGCYLLIGSLTLFGLGIYFVPQIGIHFAIESTKEEMLQEISYSTDRFAIKKEVSDENRFQYIKNTFYISKEILNTKSWLINDKIILELIISSLVPSMSTFIVTIFQLI